MKQMQKIALLAVVVSAAIGVYLYTANEKSQPENPDTLDTSPSPISSIAPTTSPPLATTSPSPTNDADWQTHTTSTYSVQYPNNLEVNEESGEALYLSYWGPTQEENTEFYDGISLSFQPQETGQSPEEYADNQITEIEDGGIAEVVSGPEPITINDYSGITYTSRGLGEHQTIILQGPNEVLMEITDSTVDPTNQGFQETVEQIMETFSFNN